MPRRNGNALAQLRQIVRRGESVRRGGSIPLPMPQMCKDVVVVLASGLRGTHKYPLRSSPSTSQNPTFQPLGRFFPLQFTFRQSKPPLAQCIFSSSVAGITLCKTPTNASSC